MSSIYNTVKLPIGITVLAKEPGQAYHYANTTQAQRKVEELAELGIKASIWHGRGRAKYIRIDEDEILDGEVK